MAPGDLPRRLGVAVVGIPAVLGLLYLGGWVLAAPVALLAALGAREVCHLAEARGVRPSRALSLGFAAALVVGAGAAPDYAGFAPVALLLLVSLFGLAALWSLGARGAGDNPLGAVSVTVVAALYTGVPLAMVVLLHALPTVRDWGSIRPSPWMGAMVVALPLAATWVGDSAAYFAGSAWGRNGRKLAPAISPNKSWVGAGAGLLGSAAAGALWWLVAAPFLPGAPVPGMMGAAAAGAVLGVGAQAGDLFESLLKREAGVKDSGTLFPGHGGALDRLDALVFTLPLAYALLALAEMLA